MRLITLLFFSFFFFCKNPVKANSLLNHYARIDTRTTGTYLSFYANAKKYAVKAQPQEKMQAYLASAFLNFPEKSLCTDWVCVIKTIESLDKKNYSPLFPYAIFHLAAIAEIDSDDQTALKILSYAPSSTTPLNRKISLLKGRLLQRTNLNTAVEHYREHLEKFSDAESLYFAAAAFEKLGKRDEALKWAFNALEKPEADFPFSQSGILIRNILHQKIYSLEKENQRIRLMEALRVAKDKKSALKLFDSLKNATLNGSGIPLFTHYAARLLIDKARIADAAHIIEKNQSDFFKEENEKAVLDVCERLLKKKKYHTVENLFSQKKSTKATLQCQLRSALRQSKFNSLTRAIAAEYIKNFDSTSTLAERIFLRSCLPDTQKHNTEISITCLEELRSLTQENNELGAGARYYLAREYEKQGNIKKAQQAVYEIASRYHDDFYFYRLFEKPLSAQKNFFEKHPPRSENERKIFNALSKQDLAIASPLALDKNLVDLESAIKERMQNLDETRTLALLLFAAESREEARELLRDENRANVYKDLIAMGSIAEKPDIALHGIRFYLRDKKIKPFIFEIPPFLRDALYPQIYKAPIEKYAKMRSLDPAAVFALVRQESHFFPAARSAANAQGLMQLLPSTAKLVAQKEKMRHYALYEVEDNIRLGTRFMRDLINTYSEDFVGVAISYNAGPGRYVAWRKKLSTDADIFIEEIPFQETYNYVRVLSTDRVKYEALLKQK